MILTNKERILNVAHNKRCLLFRYIGLLTSILPQLQIILNEEKLTSFSLYTRTSTYVHIILYMDDTGWHCTICVLVLLIYYFNNNVIIQSMYIIRRPKYCNLTSHIQFWNQCWKINILFKQVSTVYNNTILVHIIYWMIKRLLSSTYVGRRCIALGRITWFIINLVNCYRQIEDYI